MASTYRDRQQEQAIAWKKRTPVLSLPARRPAAWINQDGEPRGWYDFCIPVDYAAENLLPEASGAIDLFDRLGARWHSSVAGGPSNHLLSSQVQCVNALFAMTHDPERIVRAFGHVVDIAEVLPIEDGRFLTFEYIGPVDYFGEGNGAARTRGSKCTSVDAAFLHRTSEGLTELALVEWKYTEQYAKVRPASPGYDRTRTRRYGPDYFEPNGPLRSDLLPIELMFDEPFYQLMRQQLLAHRLEIDLAEGAEIVRVLHVLSPDNVEYQQSLVRPEHRELGETVDAVWRRIHLQSDRYVTVDPAVFLNPDVTSWDYVDRYGVESTDLPWGVSVWRRDGRVIAAVYKYDGGYQWCHISGATDTPRSMQELAALPGREWLPLHDDEKTLIVGPLSYAQAFLASVVTTGLDGVGNLEHYAWPPGAGTTVGVWPVADIDSRLPG